ncbi:MAG: pentapeptide repeat-containing protein, partial [Bacteroidota bacterium]
MEEDKASYEQLESQNKELKAKLDAIEQSNRKRRKFFFRFSGSLATAFIGRGLKASIKDTLTEFNTEKKISAETASNLGTHLVLRLTRIGVFAFVIAILPTLFLIIQTVYLGKQNDKIDKQNELITNQNARLEQQTYLQEAGRRSSLVFLMNNVLDKMDEELKDTLNKDRNLSDQLIGRIVSLSKSLKPYKYLENDSLSMTLSPERGQLLVNLMKANLGFTTYNKIFENGDFSYSELNNISFFNNFFGDINLSNSKFTNVEFNDCKFSASNFSNSIISNLSFQESTIYHIDVSNSIIERLLFNNTRMVFLKIDDAFVDALAFTESFVLYLSFYESLINKIYFDSGYIDYLQMIQDNHTFFHDFAARFPEKRKLIYSLQTDYHSHKKDSIFVFDDIINMPLIYESKFSEIPFKRAY